MFKKSPALFLLIFVVAGILFADFFRVDISYFFFSLILLVVATLFFYKSNKQTLVVICIALGILSFVSLRFASLYYETGQNHVSNYSDSKTNYTIYGEISDWPELKLERTELVVELDSIESKHVRGVQGKILLKINMPTTQFQRGDKVIFSGRIYPVEGESFSKEFNYNRFLRYKQINGVVYQTTPLYLLHDKANRYSFIPFVDNLRDAITGSFKRNLSPTSAALASGFLIGETRDIPPNLYKRFKDSGTLHLLAVSGSNVILVITFFSFLVTPIKLSRKKRSLFLIAVVLLFSVLSYGEPSVVRASIMAGFVLMAGLVERKYELQNVIALSALMILLYQPSQLFDLGFQLSFVIAWGLILMMPKLNLIFEKQKMKWWYKFLLFPFLLSVTAQIFSLGLIGLYFKQIPLLSPVANLFVVPIVSLAVIGVLALLIADFILPLLGLFVGSLLNLLLEFTVYIVEVFGADSMPIISVYDWTITGVAGLYLILFMLPFALMSKPYRRNVIILVFLFISIFTVSKTVAVFNDNNNLEILTFGIPGGNMAIVNPTGGEVDIIINSIKGKSYDIDEKIIFPKLKQNNITKINKLIVLKTDFIAIDDILRIATQYNADSIYIPKPLKNSFLDQIHNLEQSSILEKLVILQVGSFKENDTGYMLYTDGFSLAVANYKIRFIDKISPAHLKPRSNDKKEILLIGSNWNISENDYLLLNEIGYEKIICSKIAQTSPLTNDSKFEMSTNLVVDLFKESEFTINIPF